MNSVSTILRTKYGDFHIRVWPTQKDNASPVALYTSLDCTKPILVRVHSECLTGDSFGSLQCDCGPQKDLALKLIAKSGNGVFLYLRQEGRGIGLYEKIKAYQLQEQGHNTYEANALLGHNFDQREYSWVKKTLAELGVKKIKLLTNNTSKLSEISGLGVDIVERVPLIVKGNVHNRRYLETKNQFGHLLRMNDGTQYIGISGIANAQEVKHITEYLKKMRVNKDHPAIHLGISSDSDTIRDPQRMEILRRIFEVPSLHKKVILVLHHSFKNSPNPVSDLRIIKHSLPRVRYIQLNDLPHNHLKVVQHAVRKGYRVILPINTKQISLFENARLLQIVRDHRAVILIDNSGGTGRKEMLRTYVTAVEQCLNELPRCKASRYHIELRTNCSV